MGDQPPPQLPPPEELTADNSPAGIGGGSKRKLDDSFELARQKVKEIASQYVSEFDAAKRPRHSPSEDAAADHHPSLPSSNPPSFPVSYGAQPTQYHGLQGTSKRISIPNGKVGVVIGKQGETIKHIEHATGCKIQITKDQDADPHSLTRDVELTGTSEQISQAEQMVHDVIAETEIGSSASSAIQGYNSNQLGAEQFSMKVPNDKVGLLIGKGGETIKYMQNQSGARMQIIPLHPPAGEILTERTVYLNGLPAQIEAARALVNDVISGKRILPSVSNSYPQQAYPSTSGNWAQPAQSLMQPQQYGYIQPGNTHTPSYYGNYSTQQPAWDQQNSSTASQMPPQMSGYAYYGQHPQTGSTPLNSNYCYSQPPVTSNYDQGYNQQPSNYGQNISSQTLPPEQQKPYSATAYAPSQLDGSISSQSTQPASSYPPPPYVQPVVNHQTYWNSSGYTGQMPAQTGYDQRGYSQTAYGGLQTVQAYPPSSTQPAYGQGGYALQPASTSGNYVQGTHPLLPHGQPQLETQSQSQPLNNGVQQLTVYGSETLDGNSNSAEASRSAVKEAVTPQT